MSVSLAKAPVTPLFVNVYEIVRVYGGPEEGGWWYDMHCVVSSVEVTNEFESHVYSLAMEEAYPTGTSHRYAVRPVGADYEILVEDKAGVDSEPRHYC